MKSFIWGGGDLPNPPNCVKKPTTHTEVKCNLSKLGGISNLLECHKLRLVKTVIKILTFAWQHHT